MANCPNCGRKLRMIDWRPNCPECGVNLNYFNANEILLEETEKAEVEHAHFQPKVDRAKTAYFGDYRCILRIVFTLLPVSALFLPIVIIDGDKYNIVGLYKLISDIGFDSILSHPDRLVALGSFAISVILILVCLILLSMSLAKRGKRRTLSLYCIMAVCSVLSLLTILLIASLSSVPALGAYIYTALQIWSCVWNYLIFKKGLTVNYTKCLIGGLPSEVYFEYVEKGMSGADIRRKMLIELTKLQIELDKQNEYQYQEEAKT